MKLKTFLSFTASLVLILAGGNAFAQSSSVNGENKSAAVVKTLYVSAFTSRGRGYRKGGRKGFETIITRLQMQCYVLASDFVYDIGKDGKEYGWGVTEYSTPEKFMGRDFTENVYKCEPSESYGKILRYFKTLFPECDEKILLKMIG